MGNESRSSASITLELAPPLPQRPNPQGHKCSLVNSTGSRHSFCDHRFRLWPHQCHWLNLALATRYQTCTTEINGEKCLKTFKGYERFKRHYQTVHIGQARRAKLSCSHEGCHRVGDKGFTRKDNLTDHMRKVHGTNIAKNRVRFMGRTRDGIPIIQTQTEEVEAMDEE